MMVRPADWARTAIVAWQSASRWLVGRILGRLVDLWDLVRRLWADRHGDSGEPRRRASRGAFSAREAALRWRVERDDRKLSTASLCRRGRESRSDDLLGASVFGGGWSRDERGGASRVGVVVRPDS